MTPWQNLTTRDPNNFKGFVYLVINRSTGKWYIGCKSYRKKSGQKRYQQQWSKYRTSNEIIKSQPEDKFNWYILGVYTNYSLARYIEADLIIHSKALLTDRSYNRNVKVHRQGTVNVSTSEIDRVRALFDQLVY